MAENENTGMTAEEYIRGLMPTAIVSDTVVKGVMKDAGISDTELASEMDERQRDLALAYLLIRISFNPLTSQRVTDKDADWEHTEGSERWSKSQLQQFLILARDLLAKWGLKDSRVESLAPKWGMVGRGFRNRRKYRL